REPGRRLDRAESHRWDSMQRDAGQWRRRRSHPRRSRERPWRSQWRKRGVASTLSVMVAFGSADPGTATSELRWSVVIPAFNEAERLPRYLKEVVGYFAGRDEPYEVLVVDDGSVDDTAGVVRGMSEARPSVQLVRFPMNRGKGHAVRAGMLRARGALRLMA